MALVDMSRSHQAGSHAGRISRIFQLGSFGSSGIDGPLAMDCLVRLIRATTELTSPYLA